MKFKYESREVDSVGSISTKAIGMKTGAKAFRIIFGTMYKDIIKAVVREIFTNAWDSQKKAGTLDIPIDIHAPSKWEPYFSVRDYGTGMTPEVVDEIYSVVFNSTKDDANDEAGFMGMGSKTPLGYSDSFTLVCYVDGTYNAFDIFLNSEGSPVIAHQATGKTDEPNGCLIQLAVEDKDIDYFAKMIDEFIICSSALVKLNGKKFENKFDVIDEFENFVMYNHENIKGVHAKMGCVLYKLDSYESSNFKGFNVIFEVDIGTFDVTGSRDDIVYTSESREIIRENSNRFIKQVKEKMNAKIAEQKTYIEAYDMYKRIFLQADYTIRSSLGSTTDFKWKGYKLAYDNKKTAKTGTKNVFWGYEVCSIYVKKYGIKSARFKSDTDVIKRQDKACVVIFDDGTAKASSKKVATILNENYGKSVYWVKGKTRNSFSFLKLTTFLGVEKIYDLSNPLIKAPKTINAPREVKEIESVGVLYDNYGEGKFSIQNYVPINKKPNKYYVRFEFKSPVDNYDEIKAAIAFFNKTPSQVRSIGKTQMKFVDEYGLVDIVKEYREQSEKIVITDELVNYYVYKALDVFDKIIYDTYMSVEFPIDEKKPKANSKNVYSDPRFAVNETAIEKRISKIKEHDLFKIVDTHTYIYLRNPDKKDILIETMKKVIGETA